MRHTRVLGAGIPTNFYLTFFKDATFSPPSNVHTCISLVEVYRFGQCLKSPRPGSAQRDFDQLWVYFRELRRYFRVPGTLNEFEKTLLLSEFDSGKKLLIAWL